MSGIDPSAALYKLLSGYVEKQLAGLHVAFPCRVVSFNAETGLATVQPLLRTGEGEPAVIQDVPAIGQRLLIGGIETALRPSLRAGDTVLVVCADREIKNTLTGRIAAPGSQRRHDLNDAVIVGVFSCSL